MSRRSIAVKRLRLTGGLMFKRICVFCASSLGSEPKFTDLAREFAQELLSQKLGLVYGGATVGLMGVLADTVMAGGGEVHGVIPDALFSKEVPHSGITQLHTTQTMHERKQIMYDLADGFVALPGGLGTLDELCEVLSWAQLGLHQKPIGLVNAHGYFDGLLSFLDQAVDKQLMSEKHRRLLIVESHPQNLLGKFREYQAEPMEKWIEEGEL